MSTLQSVWHDPYFFLTDVLSQIRKSVELIQEVTTSLTAIARNLTIHPHQINDLQRLFKRIGSDQTVRIIEVLNGSPYHINSFDEALSNAVNVGPCGSSILGLASSSLTLLRSSGSDRSVGEMVYWLKSFWLECENIEDALYSQKHAFNFINLQRLREACKVHIWFVKDLGISS